MMRSAVAETMRSEWEERLGRAERERLAIRLRRVRRAELGGPREMPARLLVRIAAWLAPCRPADPRPHPMIGDCAELREAAIR